MKNVASELAALLNRQLSCPVCLRVAPRYQALPYAVLTAVSRTPQDRGLSEAGSTATAWQLDVYSRTDAEADAIVDAAVNLIDRYAPWTLGSVSVFYSAVTGIGDESEVIDPDGGDVEIVRRLVEFDLHYQ